MHTLYLSSLQQRPPLIQSPQLHVCQPISNMADDQAPKPSSTHEAGCHCGYIKFAVTLSPPLPEQMVLRCSCSMCRRAGYWLVCTSCHETSRSPGPSLSAACIDDLLRHDRRQTLTRRMMSRSRQGPGDLARRLARALWRIPVQHQAEGPAVLPQVRRQPGH
jgi:hypothetical protein